MQQVDQGILAGSIILKDFKIVILLAIKTDYSIDFSSSCG
jgi:hypothetical protein